MLESILTRLNQIESDENIKIVYACESGSRAWGFPSTDSDYDVRFIYVRPINWYLSIYEKRDVIERPINKRLDFSGWDLKKALLLFRKSNPPLLEWLGSPIVYLERYSVAQRMRDLSAVYYSPTACMYHYLHMARGNFREYLKSEEVWVKKYLYCLRPILAMKWIELGLGIVPTDFNILVDKLVTEPQLKVAINNLISNKRAGAELDRGPRIEPISEFIEEELERWEDHEIVNYKSKKDDEELDNLFREVLEEIWQL